jgi:hypothetical protein
MPWCESTMTIAFVPSEGMSLAYYPAISAEIFGICASKIHVQELHEILKLNGPWSKVLLLILFRNLYQLSRLLKIVAVPIKRFLYMPLLTLLHHRHTTFPASYVRLKAIRPMNSAAV